MEVKKITKIEVTELVVTLSSDEIIGLKKLIGRSSHSKRMEAGMNTHQAEALGDMFDDLCALN